MDVWVFYDTEAVLKHVLFNICGCHFCQELGWNLKFLDIGPDLLIEHGR